jgi:hypothetical protein
LKVIPPAESGIFIKGEVKAMKMIRLASGKSGLLIAFNNDALKLFEL